MTTQPDNVVAIAIGNDDASLRHNRLGHMSQKKMKEFLSKGKLTELKNVHFDMCESCIMGKQKKFSFLIGGRKLRVIKLELVHTDLWDLSLVASLNGFRYYITFIDDCSRKVQIYFLKNKSNVFDTFKRWKAMVETETGLRLKCLRSDNGGEYIDRGFKEYYATNGIRMEKTFPRTPQQNSVVECMTRTINECAKSMRLYFGLPKVSWSDVVNSPIYLINHVPSAPLEYRLIEEVWSRKEKKLAHLKVFGCVSYIHVESIDRCKLDAKARRCFFIGYGNEQFGY